MIIFSTPSRGQQVLPPLESEQTTSLLVVLICHIIVMHETGKKRLLSVFRKYGCVRR